MIPQTASLKEGRTMWLASLFPGQRPGCRRSRPARGHLLPRRPRPRYVTRLEALEDRTVPSTFLVENLADDGPGSLRQAVLDANAAKGPDLIAFAAGLSGTIALTSGQLDITDDLTLDGPGAEVLAVSGNDASRVFQIASGLTVAIDDLTITRGRADNGGGIWNQGGNLTLTRVVMSDNQAIATPGNSASGGGVYNFAGTGTVTVTFSTFTGNRVT